LQDFV